MTRYASRESRAICAREQRGVADLEAVGADDDDGAARDLRLVSSRKRFSDSPIRVPPSQSKTSAAARSSASSGFGGLERPRQPRQARAEAEGLPARVGAERRVGEDEQRARVGGHRAGDVEEEDEPAPPRAGARARSARPARRRCGTSGGSSGAGRARRPGRARAAATAVSARRAGLALHQLRELRELLVGAAREALVLQHLDRAREQELRLDVLLALVASSRLGPTRLEPGRRLRQLGGCCGTLAEERAEDPVVDRDVVALGRRACRGRPSRGPPGASSAAARQKSLIRPGPDGEPLVAKRAAEADQAPLEPPSSHASSSGRACSTRRRSSWFLTAQPSVVARRRRR